MCGTSRRDGSCTIVKRVHSARHESMSYWRETRHTALPKNSVVSVGRNGLPNCARQTRKNRSITAILCRFIPGKSWVCPIAGPIIHRLFRWEMLRHCRNRRRNLRLRRRRRILDCPERAKMRQWIRAPFSRCSSCWRGGVVEIPMRSVRATLAIPTISRQQ